MKYKKYRVYAEGTVYISNANAKDVRESTFLMVEGMSIRAKKIVRRVRERQKK